MNKNLLINNLIKVNTKSEELIRNTILLVTGVALLSISAQFSFYLPFSSVPVTLQTLVVLAIAITYGKKLGTTTISSYIIAGSLGAPVFASGKFGLPFLLPTGGYIIGFLIATFISGLLIDKGWSKSYIKLTIIVLVMHAIIYTCGLLQLSMFIPNKSLLLSFGLTPFLISDVIKSIIVITLLPTLHKLTRF